MSFDREVTGDLSTSAVGSRVTGFFGQVAQAVRGYLGGAVRGIPGGTDVVYPPVADFSAATLSGTAPLTVNFVNLSTNAATFAWSSGDGQTSSQRTPTFVYSTAGVYSPSLTVSNSGGSDTRTRTAYISVSGVQQPSLATLESPGTATVNAPATFTVRLDRAATQTMTVTWAVPGATLSGVNGASQSTISAGQTATSITATWSSAQTASVDFTISPAVTRAGHPASVTVTDASAGGTLPIISPHVRVEPVGTWSGNKPWTCGLLFRRGAVPAGATPGAVDGSVQVDARTVWDDGSLKYAVAAGVTAATGLAILPRGTPAAGGNVAEPSVAAVVSFSNVVDASAAAVAGGSFSADIATARTAGAGTWSRTQARRVRDIPGPVMSEFHYFVPTADPHTNVWFYVRAYSTGDVEVETVVENGWLLVAAPGRRTYDVTVGVGGSTRYTGTGIVQHHHTRWSRVDWAGADPAATMVQTPASLRGSGVLPTYGVQTLDAVAYSARPDNGIKLNAWTRDLADRPAPFSIANFDPAMGSGGATDAYGLVPEWMATWLIEGNAGAYWAVIGNGRATGRYGLHYRDEVDGRPTRPTNRITIGLNDTSLGISDNGGNGTTTPAPAGGSPPSWAYSHSPASAFSAALLTGRWSLMEEVQFASSTGVLMNTFSIIDGVRTIGWYDQLRTIAWRVRDMAQAEAISPSRYGGSVLASGADFDQRAEIVARIEAVAALWQDQYVSGTGAGPSRSARGNNLGAPYQNSDFDMYGSTFDNVHGYGGLQNGFYLTAAFYLFNSRPAIGTTAQTRLTAVMEHFAKFPIGLLGATPGAARDWRVATFVTIPLGTPGDMGSGLNGTSYYTSWDQQYTLMQTAANWEAGTWPLTPGSDTFLRYVNSNNGGTALRLSVVTQFNENSDRLALSWATMQMHEAAGRINAPGADLAVQRLVTSATWTNSEAAIFRTRPAYSLRTPRDLPSWVPSTVGAAAPVPMTNTLDAVAGSGTYTPDGNQKIGDYSGGCFNPYYSAWGGVVVHGGGHSGTNNNGVYVADLTTLTWVADGAPFDLQSIGKYVDYPDDGVYKDSYDYFIRRGPNSTGWLTADRYDQSKYEFGANWADITLNPCEIAPNQPGSAHTYDTLFTLSPEMGGGPKGSLIRTLATAVGVTTSSSTAISHRFDFATRSWSRFSTNANAWAQPAGVAFDWRTGRAWLSGTSFNTAALNFLQTQTRAWSSVAGNSGADGSGYIDNVLLAYHSTREIAVQAACSNPGTTARFYWYSTISNQGARSAVTWTNGSAPTHFNFGNGSLCDIPELGKLFYYSGYEPNVYYLFTVPVDPSQPWTWEKVTITGAVPGALSPPFRGTIYHRMDYAPRLRSIVWATSDTSNPNVFGGRVLCIRIVP